MAATASASVSAVDVGKPVDVRVRQIICFLAGALAMELLVDQGEVRFYWTPLILGLTYLAAAIVGGRDGGHWSGATALTGFGLAVAYAGHEHPQNVDISGLYVLGAGLAFAIGALAASRGWPISTGAWASRWPSSAGCWPSAARSTNSSTAAGTSTCSRPSRSPTR